MTTVDGPAGPADSVGGRSVAADLALEHAAAYPFDIPRRSYVFNPQDGTSGPVPTSVGLASGECL